MSKIEDGGMALIRPATVHNPYPRQCTCHPDDNPPVPCPRKYALRECRDAALLQQLIDALVAAKQHMWIDAAPSWTQEDFKNWATVQKIDAALLAARSKQES